MQCREPALNLCCRIPLVHKGSACFAATPVTLRVLGREGGRLTAASEVQAQAAGSAAAQTRTWRSRLNASHASVGGDMPALALPADAHRGPEEEAVELPL